MTKATPPPMADVYDDADADLSLVQARNVAILGYDAQARAHALCLRDSGVDVRVGLANESPDRELAEAEGLGITTPYAACEEADLVMVLGPDPEQPAVYLEAVQPNLVDGDALFFATGFAVRFGLVKPPAGVDVCMVAPVGPGELVRREFVDGRGVPVMAAVEQDASGVAFDLALSYARAIGATRAGALRTTFAEQAETTLFGEQAVHCGGLSALVQAGFATLTAAGYRPEVAYLACVSQLGPMAELVSAGGLTLMREAVSATTAYGAYTRGPRVVGDPSSQQLRRILDEVRDGTFAREWVAEYAAGLGDHRRLAEENRQHPVERTGERLRPLLAPAATAGGERRITLAGSAAERVSQL